MLLFATSSGTVLLPVLIALGVGSATTAAVAARGRRRLRVVERLMEDGRHRSEALRLFATQLGTVNSRGEVARIMAEGGADAVGAAMANVALLDVDPADQPSSGEGGTAARNAVFVLPASVSEPVAARWPRLPLDVATPLGDAITTGTTILVPNRRDLANRYPHLVRDSVDTGIIATASAPLRDSLGNTVGAVGFAWASDQQFDRSQVAIVEIAARICEQAIDRAKDLEKRHDGAERARLLALAVSGLASAQTQVDICNSFTTALPHLLATGGTIAVVGSHPDALQILGAPRLDSGPAATQVSLPTAGNGPLAEVFRSGTASYGPCDDRFACELLGLDAVTAEAWDPGCQANRGVRSWMGLPLLAGGRTIGAMALFFADEQTFNEEQRLYLSSFAALAANALVRTERFELEHEIAVTLQASLLPAVPPMLCDVQLAGRYRPGSRYAAVGGDWYDAVALSDGKLLLLVGDIVGHGINSAAAMGRLSTAARVLGQITPEPAELLWQLDRIAGVDSATRFTSMAVVLVDAKAGSLKVSLAGHPAPLLRHGDGVVEELSQARSVALGGLSSSSTASTRPQQEVRFRGDAVVVLYTDGLTERRSEHVDERTALLVRALAGSSCSVDRLADHLLSEMHLGEPRDDIALLCASITPSPTTLDRAFPASPGALGDVRAALRSWLGVVGIVGDDADDVLVASGEAIANAVEHAHGNDGRPVFLRASYRPGLVQVVVSDQGTWLPHHDINGLRGRGLLLMERMMTAVEIERSNSGTVVSLTKSVSHAPNVRHSS